MNIEMSQYVNIEMSQYIALITVCHTMKITLATDDSSCLWKPYQPTRKGGGDI